MKMASFYVSSATAYFAHAIFSYSLIIYAQSRGGGASESGQLLAAMYGPMLVLGLYGGMLADRYSRKTILLSSHLLAGVVTAIFGLAINGGLGVGVVLFFFAGAYGIPVSVMAATRLAFVANFAEPRAVERCTTIVKVLNVTAFGGGPLVAGWLREHVTWTQLFVVPAALWSVSIALLLSLPEARGAVVARRGSPWAELGQGLRFFQRSRILRGLGLLSAAVFGLVLGPYQVLVPLLAKGELGLGEASRGLVMGAFGGGLLAGGILSAVATPFKRRGVLMVVAIGGSCAFLTVAAYGPTFAVVVAALAVSGGFGGLLNGLVPTTMQTVTPDAMRARVLSVYYAILLGTPAVGAALWSWAAGFVGVRLALAVSGVLGVAIALAAAAWLPGVWRYETGDGADSDEDRELARGLIP
jgi:MFS family permease